MRILHIVPSYKPAYQYGGTIESVARLCEGLVQAGEQVKVFTTTANGTEELDVVPGIEYNVEGVKVIYFTRHTKDHSHITFTLWKQLYKECKQYDIIHLHSWWNILVLIAALICRMKKVKTIFSPHGMLSSYIIKNSNSKLKRIVHFLIGRSLLRSTFLHTTSEAELIECKELIRGWQGVVISNIIWLPEINILKQKNKDFTILFLSRIHPKKGIELLMEAISMIDAGICFLIAGMGEKPYTERLIKKAKELKIESKIKWLGWKDRAEKFEVLMNADLFALTSYNENFANVVVESLYMGTPVLLSAEVGLSQFVAKHDLGWITKLQVKDIKEKIEAAMHNTMQRQQISRCAPEIIRKYFSSEILIPQYLQYYHSF